MEFKNLIIPKFLYNLYMNNQKHNHNNVILEPMTCILRLLLFNYKETGTKLSIYQNSIHYNDPTMIQGVVRNLNGDTKDDLHNLYKPILKSFEWYDVNIPIYKYFYEKCINGIECLLKSYDENSIVHHTLIHYITLFRQIICDNHIEYHNNHIEDHIENHNNNHIDDHESPLLNKLQFIWKKEELQIIYQILMIIENNDTPCQKELYLHIIDEIVSLKEKNVYDFIQKSSTVYH